MKKSISVLTAVTIVSLTLVSASFGQIAYNVEDRVLSGGLGLGALAGMSGNSKLPPLSAGFEMGFDENISIGGLAGIASSEWKYAWSGDSWGWRYTYIILAGRASYHLDIFKKENIDTYGGVTLGYNIVTVSEFGNVQSGWSSSGSYLFYGGHVGLRYYFSPNLGAQIELGYGLGILNVGIAYKM